MDNPHDIDLLIVGQGLAGSLLAWHLLQRGRKILVIDDRHASSASIAAAGLLVPVTGKRLVLDPQAALLLAEAMRLYQEFQEQFGQAFYVAKPMVRLMQGEQDAATYARRHGDIHYQPYLGERLNLDAYDLHAPEGGFVIRQTGYLAIRPLLESLRQYLIDRDSYRDAHLEGRELQAESAGIRWQDVRARRVIFCDGYQARTNPWFDWLPFQPAKGEILTVQCPHKLPDMIINAGSWLLPLGAQQYRFGATYEWDVLDEQPTEQGKQRLLQSLQTLLKNNSPCQVLDQVAGVRPGTLDKQPFIGLHPGQPQLGIFNGFGSRGSLQIPLYARIFAEYLCGAGQLPQAVDVRRYYQHV
ncbi:MAG: hypothetical protein A2V90_08630 [Gammaproteobacteria bacterium RBG_16_57_12]|nr:MAG: hypothetical protein A2V90_08630 [Gammaproteobacteria bacterium RBG_16_57_12]